MHVIDAGPQGVYAEGNKLSKFLVLFVHYSVLVRTRKTQTNVIASPCVAIQEYRTETRVWTPGLPRLRLAMTNGRGRIFRVLR